MLLAHPYKYSGRPNNISYQAAPSRKQGIQQRFQLFSGWGLSVSSNGIEVEILAISQRHLKIMRSKWWLNSFFLAYISCGIPCLLEPFVSGILTGNSVHPRRFGSHRLFRFSATQIQLNTARNLRFSTSKTKRLLPQCTQELSRFDIVSWYHFLASLEMVL